MRGRGSPWRRKAASALDHPSICTIHDVDETEDGRLFIAMSLYEGRTLRERLDEGPLAIEEATAIATRVAAGLEQAHAHGLVHRDIKPSNLILTAAGEVKILDFGVAKLAGHSGSTGTGFVAGTVAYMAPEQIEGTGIDARADVWALGVVLYEMLTGRNPFERDHVHAAVAATLAVEPQPLSLALPDLPAALGKLVADALCKDPDQRLGSAREFRDRLESLRPASRESALPAKSRKPVVVAAAVAGLALLATAVFAWQNHTRSVREAARESLPRIAMLAEAGRFAEAYPLAARAARSLPDDTTAARLFAETVECLSRHVRPARRPRGVGAHGT